MERNQSQAGARFCFDAPSSATLKKRQEKKNIQVKHSNMLLHQKQTDYMKKNIRSQASLSQLKKGQDKVFTNH